MSFPKAPKLTELLYSYANSFRDAPSSFTSSGSCDESSYLQLHEAAETLVQLAAYVTSPVVWTIFATHCYLPLLTGCVHAVSVDPGCSIPGAC